MLLNSTSTLADGSRLRVRLPQAVDRAGVRALHERLGLHLEDLDVARMLRFDPRTVTVGCASRWDGSQETVVGYGAIFATAEDPHLLVCDEVAAPGVADALADALREHAASRAA